MFLLTNSTTICTLVNKTDTFFSNKVNYNGSYCSDYSYVIKPMTNRYNNLWPKYIFYNYSIRPPSHYNQPLATILSLLFYRLLIDNICLCASRMRLYAVCFPINVSWFAEVYLQ